MISISSVVGLIPVMLTFQALAMAQEYIERSKEEADKTSYTIKEFVGGAR